MSEILTIREYRSGVAKSGPLIVSVVECTSGKATVAVGSPGLPNVQKALPVGGVLLFEVPGVAVYEARLLRADSSIQMSGFGCEVLLTPIQQLDREVSSESDPWSKQGYWPSDNSGFTASELSRIAASVERIRDEVRKNHDIRPEQADFIGRRLDDIREAADRLGRKDWLVWVIGTLTNIVVSLAVNQEVSRFIVRTVGAAFGWVTGRPAPLSP